MNGISKSVEIAGRTLSMETGRLARQANGAVMVRYGDSMVLVAATMAGARPGIDFFPLTVDYRERMSAAGRYPGGFFKREGRPTEKEILTCRLIDRPIRPLFPKGFKDEVQVMATVFSADPENDPDILAMNGAFAALAVSDIPFKGPLGVVRVGRVNGELIVNPTYEQRKIATLELLVACLPNGDISLLEVTAAEESEEHIVAALEAGQREVGKILELIAELAAEAGKPKREFAEIEIDRAMYSSIESGHYARIQEAMRIAEKTERELRMKEIEEQINTEFAPSLENDEEVELPDHGPMIREILYAMEARAMRERIMADGVRIDGRGLDEIRPIEIEVGLLPRCHGSALFTRGQTQALVGLTLGTVSDEQVVDSMIEETRKKFMLHYTFPPFSVGECRPIRGPGRREIGHGALAERALLPVLPSYEDFPYTIRITSDITESNGSSSMASTCGGSLALMDAGVPVSAAVAGVSIGLVMEGGEYRLLTDILGAEDHLGDMDFKVAGTREGVTAIQLDIKVAGLGTHIVREALTRAQAARMRILDQMAAVIAEPRGSLKEHAPRIIIIQLPQAKIGEVIGPGGKMIRKIIEETGAKIDIDDDGRCVISTVDAEAARRAKEFVESIIAEAEVGKIYKGKVVRLMSFGAFVEIMPRVEGMVHISQLAPYRVSRVEDVVREGDQIWVKCVEIDSLGRVNLSKVEAEREMGILDENAVPPAGVGQPHHGGERRDYGDRGGRGDRGHGDRGGRGGRGGHGGGRGRGFSR